MKHLLCFLTFVCVFTLAGFVYASEMPGSVKESSALNIEKIQKSLPADIFNEVSVIPAKPHFLLGLEQKKDQYDQAREQEKIWATAKLMYGKNYTGIVDTSSPDWQPPGSRQLHYFLVLNDKKINVIFSNHFLGKDQMHVFWSKMGEKNLAEFSPLYRKYEGLWANGKVSLEQWKDIQRVMGWAQFEAVKAYINNNIARAVKKNVEDYAKINLTERVVAIRAKLLDDPKYKDRLDAPLEGSANLKVRDILPVPLTRPEDFLPDVFMVGPFNYGMGFANWKTPGSVRIVAVDLMILMYDYVRDSVDVTAHEFVHTNPYLQGTPLDMYYDLEMWANLTTSNDMMDFLFHPYDAVLRDEAQTYFGYDIKEAIRRMFPGQFGMRDMSRPEFMKRVEEITKIKEELMKFITDPEDGLLVRFYSDPYFWMTVNTKLCDTAGVFRVLFALKYEPAGIFDPDKKDANGKVISPAVQTRMWLDKEEEAGRIDLLAKKAMEKTGTKTKFFEELSKATDTSGMTVCPVNSRFFLMTEKEREQFLSIVRPLAASAKNGDWGARMILLRIFGTSSFILNSVH